MKGYNEIIIAIYYGKLPECIINTKYEGILCNLTCSLDYLTRVEESSDVGIKEIVQFEPP